MNTNMLFLLWNILQQAQTAGEINETRGDSSGVTSQPTEIGESLQISYFRELNKLTLICYAMWTLIEEETNLTERDLMGRITELDLKDGELDGKYTAPPLECPNCDAMVSKKFNRCLFCGTETPKRSIFDSF